MSNRSLTVIEAATALQLSPTEIDWLVSTGQIPVQFSDGQRVISERALDRLVHSYKELSRRRVNHGQSR